MDEKEIQIRVQHELQKLLEDPREAVRVYQKALEDAEKEIQITTEYIARDLMPKVMAYDIAMGTNRLIEMSAVAKVLSFRNMGRNNLFEYLKDKRILRYNNEPYQNYVDAGYFKVVRQTYSIPGYGGDGIYDKTMVTQKGVDYIGKLLTEDGYERNPR